MSGEGRDARRPREAQRPVLALALREDARESAVARGRGDAVAGWRTVAREIVAGGPFRGVALYRLRTQLERWRVPVAPPLLHRVCVACWGINIDEHIVVREGLRLEGDAVLAGLSLIGRRVTVGRYATIGTREGETFLGPEIGDDVVIGERCSVLGDCRVGAGARVAAGSVVVRDVEAGASVAGVPARPVEAPAPVEAR